MNLDTVLQSIDASFRALHKRDTAASEQLGRNAGFLSGFAEGARHQRNLEELQRRLADDPSASTMSPSEYAFHVAKLQDEIDPPMDGEKSNVDKLRERLNEIRSITANGKDYMRPSWNGEKVTDDEVFAFCSGDQATEKEKIYRYTVIMHNGDVFEHDATHHKIIMHDNYVGVISLCMLSESGNDSIPFVSFKRPAKWEREEI